MISKWIFRKVEQSWNIDDVSVIDAREMEQKKKKNKKKFKKNYDKDLFNLLIEFRSNNLTIF